MTEISGDSLQLGSHLRDQLQEDGFRSGPLKRIQDIRKKRRIPISKTHFRDICNTVGNRYGDFAVQLSLHHDRAVIERIAQKARETSSNYDCVNFVLEEWWRIAHHKDDAMIELYRALVEVDLKNLAGSIFPNILDLHSSVVAEVAETCEQQRVMYRQFAGYLGLDKEEIKLIDCKFCPKMCIKDRIKKIVDFWEENFHGYPLEKLSVLVKACRQCGCDALANEIEQGLDMNNMQLISRMVDATNNWAAFSQRLGISKNAMYILENCYGNIEVRVFHMLQYWSQGQPFSVHKLSVISSALEACQLNNVALDICRGLDNTQLDHLVKKLLLIWQKLAEWLDLTQTEIDNVAHKYYKNDGYCCREILEIWRRRSPVSSDLLGGIAKILKERDEYTGLSDSLQEGLHDVELDRMEGSIGSNWHKVATCLGFDQKDINVTTHGLYHERQNAEKAFRILCRFRYQHHQGRLAALINCLNGCGLQSVSQELARNMAKLGTISGHSASLSGCVLSHTLGIGEQELKSLPSRLSAGSKSCCCSISEMESQSMSQLKGNSLPICARYSKGAASDIGASGTQTVENEFVNSRNSLQSAQGGAIGRTDDKFEKAEKTNGYIRLQPDLSSPKVHSPSVGGTSMECSETCDVLKVSDSQMCETAAADELTCCPNTGTQNNNTKEPSCDRFGDWNPFLKTVARIIHPIWRTLAEKLQFTTDDCDEFQKALPSICWWATFKMLSAWRNKCQTGKTPSQLRTTIADVVRPLNENIADDVLAVSVL